MNMLLPHVPLVPRCLKALVVCAGSALCVEKAQGQRFGQSWHMILGSRHDVCRFWRRQIFPLVARSLGLVLLCNN